MVGWQPFNEIIANDPEMDTTTHPVRAVRSRHGAYGPSGEAERGARRLTKPWRPNLAWMRKPALARPAVTVVVEAVASALSPAPQPFKLVADRPFFFAVRDDSTGTLLFVGVL